MLRLKYLLAEDIATIGGNIDEFYIVLRPKWNSIKSEMYKFLFDARFVSLTPLLHHPTLVGH